MREAEAETGSLVGGEVYGVCVCNVWAADDAVCARLLYLQDDWLVVVVCIISWLADAFGSVYSPTSCFL